MRLDLAVTLPGAEATDVTIDLADLDDDDMARATALVGVQAMRDLEAGEWNERGAAALVHVALEKQGVEFGFDLLDLDLGALAGFFTERDRDMEATLTMEQGP